MTCDNCKKLKRDLLKALKLAHDLEAGIGWYNVEPSVNKLHKLRMKYKQT